MHVNIYSDINLLQLRKKFPTKYVGKQKNAQRQLLIHIPSTPCHHHYNIQNYAL